MLHRHGDLMQTIFSHHCSQYRKAAIELPFSCILVCLSIRVWLDDYVADGACAISRN
jgi:hypothetical protein